MSIKKMIEKLNSNFGVAWTKFYYEKLNEREDHNWAICETYNKYFTK
jgi:hypothetical protein